VTPKSHIMLVNGGDRVPTPAEERISDFAVLIKSPAGKGNWLTYGVRDNKPIWYTTYGDELTVLLVPLRLDGASLSAYSAKLADLFMSTGYSLHTAAKGRVITDVWHLVGTPINPVAPDSSDVRVWYGAAAFLR